MGQSGGRYLFYGSGVCYCDNIWSPVRLFQKECNVIGTCHVAGLTDIFISSNLTKTPNKERTGKVSILLNFESFLLPVSVWNQSL